MGKGTEKAGGPKSPRIIHGWFSIFLVEVEIVWKLRLRSRPEIFARNCKDAKFWASVLRILAVTRS